MRTRWAYVAMALGLGFAVGACGGSGDGTSNGSGGGSGSAGAAGGGGGGASGADGGVTCTPDVKAPEFAAGYADAVCNGVASCCTSGGMSFDVPACVSQVKAAVQSFVDAAVCRGSKYVAAEGQHCFDALSAYSKSCLGDAALYHAANQACDRAFDGPGQPGDPCETTLDCAQPAHGYATCLRWSSTGSDGGMASGVLCQSHPTAQPGEACASGHDPVEPTCDESAGVYCNGGATDTCEAAKAQGSPCVSGDRCASGTECSGGTCSPIQFVPLGDACTGASHCAPHTHCDSTSATCVAYAAIGEACASLLDCETGNCKAGKCVPSNSFTAFFGAGTCN